MYIYIYIMHARSGAEPEKANLRLPPIAWKRETARLDGSSLDDCWSLPRFSTRKAGVALMFAFQR